MDVLIPALLAVLLSEIGGKTQNFALAHAMAGQSRSGLLALLLSSLIAYGAAAFGGTLIGPMIPLEAQSLMVGVALLAAGVPMVMKARSGPALPAPPSISRSIFGFATTQFGDGAQFLVFALAAKGGGPWLALLGGLFGVAASAMLAMTMAKDWPQGGRLTAMRIGAGVLLSVAGFVAAISALQLI